LVLQQCGPPKPFADVVERADRDVELAVVEKIEDVEGPARPRSSCTSGAAAETAATSGAARTIAA